MSKDRLPLDESFLREKLNSNPMDWDTRLLYADGLYDKHSYADAAEIIWSGRFLPSNDLDIALAIRILAQAQPRKAIRLLSAVLLLNQGKPAHNMALAAQGVWLEGSYLRTCVEDEVDGKFRVLLIVSDQGG